MSAAMIRRIGMAAMVLGAPGLVAGRPLTLSPVGAPVPGNSPVGLTVAEMRDAAFAMVGDAESNEIRSLRIDRTSGLLTLVGSTTLPNGPSALAVARGGRFGLATTQRGNDVTSYAIDPSTGLLTLVGSVPSGGLGPVSLDVSKGGVAVIANKDSDNLGVVKIDRTTGLLTLVGSTSVCDAPNDVKVVGRNVVVGCAISNDISLLRLQGSSLAPIAVQPLGSAVTGVTALGRDVVAGTADGSVHYLRIKSDQLVARGSYDTGGEVTDVTLVEGGPLAWSLFVGGQGRMLALMRTNDGIAELGELALESAAKPRDLVAVVGKQKTTFVLSNGTEDDLTRVVAARRARRQGSTTSSTTSSSSSTSTSSTSSTTSTTGPSGSTVSSIPIRAPEGLWVVPLFFFEVFFEVPEEHLAVLVAGVNGWAIVDTHNGDVLLSGYFDPAGRPVSSLFGAVPLGWSPPPAPTLAAGPRVAGEPPLQGVIQVGVRGPAITLYDVEAGDFGFTQIFPGSPACLDAVPNGNDPLSGEMVLACGQLQTLRPHETSEYFTFGPAHSGFTQGTGPAFSAFRRHSDGPIVAVTDGTPGKLFKHAATGTLGEMPQELGNLGNSPRRIRCAGDVCAVSNFASDSLTVVTWNAQDVVSIVGTVAVGDGPVGIDIRGRTDGNVEVISTGLNDGSYSVTVLSQNGGTVSNQKRAVPAGCTGPGHAVWGSGRQVLMTCNGSDAIAVVEAP